MARSAFVAAAVAFMLTACEEPAIRSTRHLAPIPPQTLALMAKKGMSLSDPILMRAYKKESELEVWKRRADGKYARLKTFPICRWSGQLGPKIRQGDRQAPEGFYTVTPGPDEPELGQLPRFRHWLTQTPMTARMAAPAPISWCTAAAPRAAASP